jgi:4-hydroxy-tetrahydrodipicolinate synthase
MKDNGDVDYDGFERLVTFQLEEGIDGLVPLGTSGENPTLSDDEEERLIRIAVRTAGGAAPVVVGAGSNDTAHMKRYVERAKALGADAALVVTPYYNKPNDSGLLAHFSEAARVGIPIIVYNIGSRTGRNIPCHLMQKIAGIPGIAGIKEASGDITQMQDMLCQVAEPLRREGRAFTVLSGDDALTLPFMSLGGDGVVSVVSNLYPKKVAALVRACRAGNFEEGRRLHYELLPFFRAAFIETNPVPIKQALLWAGLPAGPCRLPLGPLDPAHEAALRAAMQAVTG